MLKIIAPLSGGVHIKERIMKEIQLTVEQANFLIVCVDAYTKEKGLQVAKPSQEIFELLKDTFQVEEASEDKE